MAVHLPRPIRDLHASGISCANWIQGCSIERNHDEVLCSTP
jgi:hypothetical protein